MSDHKNIVFLHLETLPQLYFWQYQAYLPTIWNLKEESLYFSRCYATGSATVFAINSLYWGSVAGVDGTEVYNHNAATPSMNNSIIDYLRENFGYTSAFFSVYIHREQQDIPLGAYLPAFDEKYSCSFSHEWENKFDDFLRRSRHSPFCVHVHCFMDPVHSCLPHSLFRKNLHADYGDMMAATYAAQDDVASSLLKKLKQYGRMDDTAIIAFGDHGAPFVQNWNDEEPVRGVEADTQASLIPMFVHNANLGKGTTDRLASLDDLPVTISKALFPECPAYHSGLPFHGVDLAAQNRRYVITQNRYALQKYRDAQEGKDGKKSYGITDGSYRLIVRDVVTGEDGGGLELYDERSDPFNTHDFLQYFALEHGEISGLSDLLVKSKRAKGYELCFLNPVGMASLKERFTQLRNELQRYVREKEHYALQQPKSSPWIMAEEAFVKARSDDRKDKSICIPLAANMQRFIDMNRRILLFGYPQLSPLVMAILEHYGLEILGFLDNNPLRQGDTFDGQTVYSPEEGVRLFPDAIVIGCILTEKNDIIVKKQCEDLGFRYYSYIRDILAFSLTNPD